MVFQLKRVERKKRNSEDVSHIDFHQNIFFKLKLSIALEVKNL
jgi:hypothetical protein